MHNLRMCLSGTDDSACKSLPAASHWCSPGPVGTAHVGSGSRGGHCSLDMEEPVFCGCSSWCWCMHAELLLKDAAWTWKRRVCSLCSPPHQDQGMCNSAYKGALIFSSHWIIYSKITTACIVFCSKYQWCEVELTDREMCICNIMNKSSHLLRRGRAFRLSAVVFICRCGVLLPSYMHECKTLNIIKVLVLNSFST